MMVRQASGIMDLWFKPRLHLIGFLIFSIVLILASIVTMATYLVNRIHAADRRRIQALHQMANANKLASLGRLASGVAHEVNNPLAIINQKAGLIQDLFTINARYAADPKILGLVEDVLVSVRRCGAITRRLLDFARHMDSEIEALDLEAVIRQILAFMEKDAQRRCISIAVTVSGEIPIFEGDRGNLQQVFLNLINNALAAMAEGGRLEVAISRPEPRRVRVAVSDTGHGIPEADLKEIFEPFFSTRQGPAAAGLGLSIAYGMVTEMGGEITVESQVNQGTRVTVTLPLQPPRPLSPPACTVDPAQPPAGDGRPNSDREGRRHGR
jgi:signal transduction histidine kinase